MDLGAKAKKKHNFETFFRRNFTRKINSAKIEKSAGKSQSQPWCRHLNTIYDVQLQKAIATIYIYIYIYIYSITCITHAAAAPSNLDAAITMNLDAFCSVTWLTRMYLRTWQHQMTTIMQPFQCDLQPQVQETYKTTHTKTTTRCRTQRWNQFADETTPAATAAHRRYLSSPAAAALHRKTQGFVLRLTPQNNPCNIHAAITMRFAVSHHPSLSVLLCDVNSHATLHWVSCYVMSNLTPLFIESNVMWCKVSHHHSLSVLLCDVKFHTTFHWA